MKIRGSIFLLSLCGFAALHWLQASDVPEESQSNTATSGSSQKVQETANADTDPAFIEKRELLIQGYLEGSVLGHGSLTLPTDAGVQADSLTRRWVAWHDKASIWVDVEGTLRHDVITERFPWGCTLANHAMSFKIGAYTEGQPTEAQWAHALEVFKEGVTVRNVAVQVE